MAKRLALIVFLASHLFMSGVLSASKLTIENKCNYTIWPVLFSYKSQVSTTYFSQVSTTGFALRRGEARDIQAPSSWHGLVSARTLCSTNVSTGNLSCATGDCESGKLECPGEYSWSPTTYAEFRIDYEGTNTHSINVKYGYNLPLMVVPSLSSETCITCGCSVDLNSTCPHDLKVFAEGKPIACESACARNRTRETCCDGYFNSKQNCKPTQYTQNFESACPLAYVYSYGDNNSTFKCPTSTDYVVAFCPSSIPSRNSMAPLGGAKDNSQWKLKLILGGSGALAAIIIIVGVMVLVRAKNARRKRDSNDENIDAAVMLKRYSYENVKKMTNSFDQVLGKGGFGTVYKGKLPDASGRDIAIKILDETNGNGEDFINELASMSIASHVNIVSLFGFCYEGSKRAIIYEFMPNGSLDKFLSENMSTKMDWRALYNIAAGVARGLEYLHNSCVSKIVHFDIKPHNILMDEDMCPKISDFGLAKLCKNKDSIISMLDARGTVGYIAPEVFSKSYGGVSHKSDVYSYGMVVLEMIGAKNKERAEASSLDRSTMYFPDWIYEDLERREAMRFSGDQVIEDEEEEEIVTKMTLVGLWCIQTIPSDRPPMREVVEMLAGSLDALVVPPKPLLTLPVVMASQTTEQSQETSSLLTPSQLE